MNRALREKLLRELHIRRSAHACCKDRAALDRVGQALALALRGAIADRDLACVRSVMIMADTCVHFASQRTRARSGPGIRTLSCRYYCKAEHHGSRKRQTYAPTRVVSDLLSVVFDQQLSAIIIW